MIADCKVARRISRPGITGARGRLHDWFCERHAADHNKRYNFFDTLSDTETASFWANERSGHRPSWKFGADSPTHMSARRQRGIRPLGQSRPRRTRLQLKSLAVLDLPADATGAQVRERYARLVKVCHPDANGGDRSMEERLDRVIKAFKILKNARLA